MIVTWSRDIFFFTTKKSHQMPFPSGGGVAAGYERERRDYIWSVTPGYVASYLNRHWPNYLLASHICLVSKPGKTSDNATKWSIPECLPFLLAAIALRTRDLEWMTVGLRIIRPSLTNFLTFCRELAFPISVVSFGSSQILRFPHLRTEAANRFCSRRVLQRWIHSKWSTPHS